MCKHVRPPASSLRPTNSQTAWPMLGPPISAAASFGLNASTRGHGPKAGAVWRAGDCNRAFRRMLSLSRFAPRALATPSGRLNDSWVACFLRISEPSGGHGNHGIGDWGQKTK